MSWKRTACTSVCVAVLLWSYVLIRPHKKAVEKALFSWEKQAVALAKTPNGALVGAPAAPVAQAAAPRRARTTTDASTPLLIKNATIWTGDKAGSIIKNGGILIKDGKIAAVGQHLQVPDGTRTLDAKGKIVTPGLIDTHSHMGVYPSVGLRATADGNEWTRPVTAYAWAEHSVWTQDPGFPKAVAGGATTVQILPGSANLIGGRSVIVKLKLKRSVHEMKFPGASHGLKMACGENPKRVHRGLKTRMGNYAGYRKAFLKAKAYLEKWKKYRKALAKYNKAKAKKAEDKRASDAASALAKGDDKADKPDAAKGDKKPAAKKKPKKLKKPNKPRVDINLETLKLAMEGKILVHIHCYRAEEMIWMMRLAKEFGFKIRSFHHAVEAYKIRDILAKADISVSTWADWWGFKLEAFDGIQENAALIHAANGRAIIHSDSAIGVQRLNHEAGKALYRGRAMGLEISDQQALRWITSNPAWALGIQKQTGTIEVGKMADIAIWDGHPFKVYTRTTHVLIDGEIVFDRRWPPVKTDFELGLFLR